MSSSFSNIVNRETVLSFGVKPSEWDEDDQASLHEAMILAWKENPDWTDEEATAACKEQVEQILLRNFKQTYKIALQSAQNLWYTPKQAYAVYRSEGKKRFEILLNEQVEFTEFADEFYNDLRQMYNICSAGMMDAFQDMKKKGWTHDEYRRDLQKRQRRSR